MKRKISNSSYMYKGYEIIESDFSYFVGDKEFATYEEAVEYIDELIEENEAINNEFENYEPSSGNYLLRYKYEGVPKIIRDEGNCDLKELVRFTHASNLSEAERNFKYQIAKDYGYGSKDILIDLSDIKSV